MKVAILGFLILGISWVSGSVSFAKDKMIYTYEFEIEKAKVKKRVDVSEIIAKRLKSSGNSRDCIDLRSLGGSMFYSGELDHDKINYETVGLLAREKITNSTIKLIRKEICPKFPQEKDKCNVFVKKGQAKVNDLKIVTRSIRAGKENSPYKSDQRQREYPLKGKLPQFSKACKSGKQSDSWNDAAGTTDAINYLKMIGADLSDVRTIELFDPYHEVWTFGFPSKSTKAKFKITNRPSSQSKKVQ